jgi:adenylate cyclase
MEAVSFFKGGVGYYRKAEWNKAIGAFQEVLALNPEDALSRIYVERCQYMKDHPPGDNWDGVYVMKSK